ncbi:MAG TPA: hypothetical protein VEK57_23605 [Thermoanaerobaculia bacterium]|nr:hypothetical protein [Thermoanaerobaculia bacterium]
MPLSAAETSRFFAGHVAEVGDACNEADIKRLEGETLALLKEVRRER